MSLTVAELESGIAWWRKTTWPQDFHNIFYIQMRIKNSREIFSKEWLNVFLPELTIWKALRPKSPLLISDRTIERFQRLKEAWIKCMTEEVLASDIAQVRWAQVSLFVEIVAEIKGVTSPVFPSKFCHFLAPPIFPVIDNAAMGNPFSSYEAYYQTAQSEWVKTPENVCNELLAIFSRNTASKLSKDYPFKCKIIELCLIGRHQNTGPSHPDILTSYP